MITIETIKITNFRGIKDILLDLKSKSFLVWGPNGSGKSGVVDAIDFALTGDLRRISGPGFGSVTVSKHGPHVLYRDDPGSAQVTMKVLDVKSGKTGTLTRNVNTPHKFVLKPEDADVRTAIEQAGAHPEITLSRREIIEYIIAQPTERATQVQLLLKLDRLGAIRSLLRSTQGKLKATEKSARDQVEAANGALKRNFNIPELSAETILTKVNASRKILDLDQLTELKADTDLSEGIDETDKTPRFEKSSALRDVDAVIDGLENSGDLETNAGKLSVKLRKLVSDPSIGPLLEQRELVASGLLMVSEPICPLCDVGWPSIEELQQHLESKHSNSKEAGELRESLGRLTQAVQRASRDLRSRLKLIVAHAASYGPDGLSNALNDWSNNLIQFEDRLESPSASEEIDRLAKNPVSEPEGIREQIGTLKSTITELPDLTAASNATKFLTVAQDRFTTVRQSRKKLARAEDDLKVGQVAYKTYCNVADNFLEDLYKSVAGDFSEFYQVLNKDDESNFKATLIPSAGKLDLEVDFYGQGPFPPAAYHSEGHQDGMGICLYLALVSEVLGDDFRLAVLDDVVMSVDVNHRRQFCELLKSTFPDVQFVITTHDEVWANQMQRAALVSSKNQVEFFGWTVADGPIHEEGVDLWEKVQESLDRNDVSGAAGRLRRNVESMLKELAASLQSKVVYRGDAGYALGELMNSVSSQHKKLLAEAATSANSWNDEKAKEDVKALQGARKAATLAQHNENWMVNLAVHSNEWASFSPADFLPVVDAWKQFFELFHCENPECTGWIHVGMDGTKRESLRCPCVNYSLNLRKKP